MTGTITIPMYHNWLLAQCNWLCNEIMTVQSTVTAQWAVKIEFESSRVYFGFSLTTYRNNSAYFFLPLNGLLARIPCGGSGTDIIHSLFLLSWASSLFSSLTSSGKEPNGESSSITTSLTFWMLLASWISFLFGCLGRTTVGFNCQSHYTHHGG